MAARRDFQRFKAVCVPLLACSKLTPQNTATVSSSLLNLLRILRETDPAELDEPFIRYIFFPLKTILERNSSNDIPDQILEKLLLCFEALCEAWWWTCDLDIWKQIFILCGSVLGGMESKGKARARDDETREAAVLCMQSLLRKRTSSDAHSHGKTVEEANTRYAKIQEFTSAAQFVPILGQSIDYILGATLSTRPSFQQASLELMFIVADAYASEDLMPTVLPGIASNMTKVCLGLGTSQTKGWANGDIVAAGLKVLQVSIVKAIGDEVCLREGALPRFENLEDLASFRTPDETPPNSASKKAALVTRTPTWLRATASQLHIALNTLNPLTKHPTPSAIYGLVEFSTAILSATVSTLPQSQPLLLSFLLSAANSPYPRVSGAAVESLKGLLSSPTAGSAMAQQLVQITNSNLTALPRLLSSQSDARIQHVAEMITSVCRVGIAGAGDPTISSIGKVIGKLLGPTGGIEKWGNSLLAVLEFVDPSVTETHQSTGQLAIESNPEMTWVPFPELVLKNVSQHETKSSIENMLRNLGQAGGDSCLFSVEWFINAGRSSTHSRSVAALWCGCRILEGIADVQLSSESSMKTRLTRSSKRLEKQVRALARGVAELWDSTDFEDLAGQQSPSANEELDFDIKHQRGLVPLDETLRIVQPRSTDESRRLNQPMLHRSLCLQLIAIAAGVLQSRFDTLLIFTLYPILHSTVSPISFLSSCGLAALNYVTIATSYASPANLLLSNFDYALDSVSRRLTRRWLDIDATKVLVALIRLVGRDVVDRAADVVEECFDRLDAFHGYNLIVDGLIAVLLEVLNVIESDVQASESNRPVRDEEPSEKPILMDSLDSLLEWLPRRHGTEEKTEDTDFGPAPRKAWGQEKVEEADSDDEEDEAIRPDQETEEAPSTASQLLTKQIISRSLYFLTHDSPIIRARILSLLNLSVPVLPEQALLPSINNAWPFILNRLSDKETFVISSAAQLVETLSTHVGSFMYRRVWDDIWPRFQVILEQLATADSKSALARRSHSAIGTESAYTHSHRLYRSIINTMTAVMRGVHTYEPALWKSLMLFRRFLGRDVHIELQQCARQFYLAAGEKNPDSVWLVLEASTHDTKAMRFMLDERWHIEANATTILQQLGQRAQAHVH